LDIYEIIYNYFIAMRTKWPNGWNNVEKKGNLLPRSNAFKALMRYLKNEVYPSLNRRGKVIPKVEEFLPYFNHVDLSDDDFTVKNFVPGSGGVCVL
jgi:hypothetical protein